MINLPKELTAIILYNLEFKDLFLNVNLTCKKFHELINKIWFRIKYMSQYKFDIYCNKTGPYSNDIINYINTNGLNDKINLYKYISTYNINSNTYLTPYENKIVIPHV